MRFIISELIEVAQKQHNAFEHLQIRVTEKVLIFSFDKITIASLDRLPDSKELKSKFDLETLNIEFLSHFYKIQVVSRWLGAHLYFKNESGHGKLEICIPNQVNKGLVRGIH